MKLALNSKVLNRYRQLANNDEKTTQELVNKVLKEWLEMTPAQHEGKKDEEEIRKLLYKHKSELNIKSISQYDIVIETRDGQFFMVENKKQEYFKAPPFDAHGLPVWQVEKYLRQQESSNMRVLLLINDPDKGKYYKAWLDDLQESGNWEDTRRTKRRIFNLAEYDSLENDGDEQAFVEWFKDVTEPIFSKIQRVANKSVIDDETPF